MNIINIINELNENDSIQLRQHFIDALKRKDDGDDGNIRQLLQALRTSDQDAHNSIAFIMAYKDLDIASINGTNLNQRNRDDLTLLANGHIASIASELQKEARVLIERLSPEAISSQLKKEHSDVSKLVDDIVKFYMMQDKLHQKIEDLNKIQCAIKSHTKTELANSSITIGNKQIDEKISSRLESTNEFFVENSMNTSDKDKKNNKMSSSLERTPSNKFESYINDDDYSADNSNLEPSESDTENGLDSRNHSRDSNGSTENGSETTKSKTYLSLAAEYFSSFFSGSNKQENIEPAKNMNHEQSVMTFDASKNPENPLEEPPAFKQLQSMQKAEYTVIRKQLCELRKERNTQIAEFSANDVKHIKNQIEALKNTDLDSVMDILKQDKAKDIDILRTAVESNDGKSTQYGLLKLRKASDLNNSAIGIDTTDIPPAQGERLATAYKRLHIVYQTINGLSDNPETIEIPIGYYVNLKFYGMGNTTKFIPLDDDFEKVGNHFRVGAVSPLLGIMNNYSIKNEYTIGIIYNYRYWKEYYINLRDHKNVGYIIQSLEYLIYWPLYGVGYVFYLIGKLIMNSGIGFYKLVREFFSNQYVQSTFKLIALTIVVISAAVIACFGLGLAVGAAAACAVVALACSPFYIGYRWFYEGRFYEDMNTVGAFMFEVEVFLFVVVASLVLAAVSSLKFGIWTAIAAIVLGLMIAGVVLEFIFSNGISLLYSKANERYMWVTGVMSTIDIVKGLNTNDLDIENPENNLERDLYERHQKAEANKPSNKMYNKLFGRLTSFVNSSKNILVDFWKALKASFLDVINKIFTNNWDSSYQPLNDNDSNDSNDVQTDNTRHYDDYLRKGIASGQEKGIGNARAQVTSFNGAVYSSVSSSVSSVSSLFSSKQSGDADIREPLLERDQQSDDSETLANNPSLFGSDSTLTVNPLQGNNNLSQGYSFSSSDEV